MRRTFEFRLYPTKKQEDSLLRTLLACQRLYNAVLWQRQMARSRRLRLSRFDQERQLSDLRRSNPEFGTVHCHVLQDVVKRVDLAFQAFFRRVKAGLRPGYPRFRSRDRYDSFSFKEPSNGCVSLANSRLSLSKVADGIRVFQHRPVLGTLQTVTVKRRASGWYVTLSCDDVPKDPALVHGTGEVGVDVGLTHFATLSTGEEIPNPRFLNEAAPAIISAQRSVSRKVRGSNRRRKARRILSRRWERLANRRKDFCFKTARRLVERFGAVAVEDLNVAEMLEHGNGRRALHRSIADASWARFLRALEQKAEEAAALVARVEPRGTTQGCSGCGAVVPKGLWVRVHRCPRCGLVLGRDHNAALNILQRARTEPSWRERNGAPVEARSPCL